MSEGNACRGFVIGTLIAIPVYGGLAWLVQLAWNALLRPHIAYWQALVALLVLGAVTGGIIGVWAMQRAREIE